MRRGARELRHLLLALGVALAAAPASAHGPAPVALEVLALDGDEPALVHTNVGLAASNGDGTYAYVCPSRWDGNERALAVASPDGQRVLVHSAGVAFLSRDGGCAFEPLALEDRYVTAAAPGGAGFVLLAEGLADPSLSEVLEVGPDGAPSALSLELPAPADGLSATSSGLLLSGAGPPSFVVLWDGITTTSLFEGASEASRAVPLAYDGETAWLLTTGSGLGPAIVPVTDGALGEPRPFERSAHGPVRHAGRWLAVLDGRLSELVDGAWVARGEVPWTCLRSYEGRIFACSLEVLSELEGAAPIPDAVPRFSMRQLGPPEICGDEEAIAACERDWAHFGGESGWLETDPARGPTEPRRTPGCAMAPGRGGSWWWLGLAALALRRRGARRAEHL